MINAVDELIRLHRQLEPVWGPAGISVTASVNYDDAVHHHPQGCISYFVRLNRQLHQTTPELLSCLIRDGYSINVPRLNPVVTSYDLARLKESCPTPINHLSKFDLSFTGSFGTLWLTWFFGDSDYLRGLQIHQRCIGPKVRHYDEAPLHAALWVLQDTAVCQAVCLFEGCWNPGVFRSTLQKIVLQKSLFSTEATSILAVLDSYFTGDVSPVG